MAINTNGDQVSSSQILLNMYSADAKLELNAVGSWRNTANAALHISEVEKSPADTMISGGQVGYKAQPWQILLTPLEQQLSLSQVRYCEYRNASS